MKNKALENSVGELSLRKPIIDNVNEAVIARCSLLSSREFAKVLRLYWHYWAVCLLDLRSLLLCVNIAL